LWTDVVFEAHVDFLLSALWFSSRQFRSSRAASIYEVRPRADKRGFDLISDALPCGKLWYRKADDAVGYAKFYGRSDIGIVHVFDDSGALIETHPSDGAFREP
jgi:hypothetical protein